MTDYDRLHGLWNSAHAGGSPTKFVRNAVVYRELGRLIPGRTLDAGCGTGEYSIFLSKLGHKVISFDPSQVAIEELMAKGGLELGIQAQLNTIQGYGSSQQFDNIISIEVVEHIESDQTAVQKLHSLLKDGGSLVISVPACPALFSEADRVSGHYRRYSIGAFAKLLTTCSFREIRIKRYGFPILFIYTLARKLFLDEILIDYFSSNHIHKARTPVFLPKIYQFLFIFDCLDIPLWSVGYVATCKK